MAQRRRFTPEFKRQAVQLLNAGQRPAAEIARELGVPRNRLYKWQKAVAAHGGAFPGSGRQAEPAAELARLKRELARVTEERDILKKSRRVFCEGVPMRYAFIRTHAHIYRVARLCASLAVSRSGYYAWRGRPVSAHAAEDQRLLPVLRHLHQQAREEYGAIKLWRALTRSGVRCGRHRVARLRKLAGLEARRVRRFRVIVEHHQLPPPAPNVLQQRFVTTGLNRVWVGDFTMVATRAGWLYVAVLPDLYSRRVIGWAMSVKPDQQLTLNALAMATHQRRVQPGLIHHSDQGAQYSCLAYQRQLTTLGITPSMSRKGNCYDNAVAESFFSTLKNELGHHQTYRPATTRAERSLRLLKGFIIASDCIRVLTT